MSHVDFKKRPCRPVQYKKNTLCRPVDFKLSSCHHVDFKKVTFRMSVKPKKGCVAVLILGVYTPIMSYWSRLVLVTWKVRPLKNIIVSCQKMPHNNTLQDFIVLICTHAQRHTHSYAV